MAIKRGVFLFLLMTFLSLSTYADDTDKVQLEKALAYFNSEKYHEALLIFQRLDTNYKLNDRFLAYIGLCYYYEWDYDKAVAYLDEVLPRLSMLSPSEQLVYFYAVGESYFQLGNYEKASERYLVALQLAHKGERAEIYYKLAVAQMFLKAWQVAADYFSLAERAYSTYRNSEDWQARLSQIERMKIGCLAKVMENSQTSNCVVCSLLKRSVSASPSLHVSCYYHPSKP